MLLQRMYFRSHSLFTTVLLASVLIGTTVRETPASELPVLRQAAEQAVVAEHITAPEVFPATSVAYLEVQHIDRLLDLILQHPLRKRLEALPAYQAAMKTEQAVQLNDALAIFAAAMGQRWPGAVSKLTAGGVYAAIDAETNGFAILLHTGSADSANRLRSLLVGLGGQKNADGKSDGQAEYRGFPVNRLQGDIKLAILENWIVVVNKPELGKQIIDSFIDPPPKSLSTNPQFSDSLTLELGSDSFARAIVDIKTIRESGAAEELYSGKTNNLLVEALIGGIVGDLQFTPYATAELSATEAAVELTVSTPHQSDWTGELREFYFGQNQNAAAPPKLSVSDELFSFTAYRNLSEMWLRAGDLMTEKANDDLAQADTQLTTFFSGKDFGEDILGALGPGVRLIAAQQSFENVLPKPAILLPEFAIELEMLQPDVTAPELRRIFQSFVGFINVVGAMDAQPQFDLGSQELEGHQLYTATYVPAVDQVESTSAPINFNFSPTIGFAGKRLIVSSTTALAQQLVTSTESKSEAGDLVNTAMELDAKVLGAVLTDNFDTLVAQNMLEKGHSRSAAEGEIGLLLQAVRFLNSAAVRLIVEEESLSLQAKIELESMTEATE